MSDITLSAGVRQNLLSLQSTADLMAKTQNRLATGKKVNSALDNPTNFFTSSALQARSKDLSSLLDSMSNGIKTLEAADNGLKSITKTVESMQSTLRQARQDKTFQTQSFEIADDATGTLALSGGAIGDTPVEFDLSSVASQITGGTFTDVDFTNGGDDDGEISFDIAVNDETAVSISVGFADVDGVAADNEAVTAEELVSIINDKLAAADVAAEASVNEDGEIVFTTTERGAPGDVSIEISNFAADNGATGSGIADGTGSDADEQVKTVDALVQEINSQLSGQIRASNDNGKLRIQNLSTQDLTVGGVDAAGQISGGSEEATVGGNEMRADLVSQFNELRDQLDKLADDASFNGINLLLGDKLTLTFNETGTSSIDIQVPGGDSINSDFLGISNLQEADFDSDASIDTLLGTMKSALDTLRSQSATFGSNLSIVQNRTEFTKNMMNTLQTGADGLVLADTNEEGANMLALQTRQQLSSTALSMASQADQAVLRLF